MAAEERLTLTVEEASKMLGISKAHGYELARTGELPSIKLGKRIVVPLRALQQFLDKASAGTDVNAFMAVDKSANSDEARAAQDVLRPRYQLAVELISLREKSGLSQSVLAQQTGIRQSEISAIERGSGNPTLTTLLALAGPLNADLRLLEREHFHEPD